jgi:hypothetical protein
MMPDSEFVSQKDYVDAVIDTYVSLPDTPNRARGDDRYLAIMWYRQGIMLFQANTAMLLATARRTFREPDALPLEPIRSLRYFVPLVEEIQHLGIDESYLRYLQQKLSSVLGTKASAEPTAASKAHSYGTASALSDGRAQGATQRFAGNAELLLALRAPGMDTRAGEFDVMDIPWGVAPRAPVQGLMKHHTRW